ncbi:hypothetical protein D9758_010806 [Tetrapyrgos nigripes]|uniref:Uncharacterized protein n=1 Tax=Tetrapyrgos nigripes TaxID=182062 RepID=A0A8H5GIT1_9AGAR|nr:hypothetical protein D9758_010806 [Tetrapyrgos nigripes]
MVSNLTLYTGSLSPSPFFHQTSQCSWCPPVPISVYCARTLSPSASHPTSHDLFANQLRTKEEGGEGLDIRPSIVVAHAHVKLSKLDETVRRGDGKNVTKSSPVKREDWSLNPSVDPGVEVARNQWNAELITRPDIKTFLPPIGNFTAYIFGDPALLSSFHPTYTLLSESTTNATEAMSLGGIRRDMVQDGKMKGVGVVVCFREEGAALGEVTKYLVYDLRKIDILRVLRVLRI